MDTPLTRDKKWRIHPIKVPYINGGKLCFRVHHPDGWLWKEVQTLDRALWHACEYEKFLAKRPDALSYRELIRAH